MPASVFALDDKPYAPWAYVPLVMVVAALCFGSLTDHLFFTHDLDTAYDYDRLNSDPSFFFSNEKTSAGGRLIDEFLFWVTYAAWGANPTLYHLLAISLHVLATLVLAHAYHRLGANRELSLLAGLLFLLNITHIQVVQWIAALEYPLMTTVAAVAICRYQAYAAAPSAGRLAAFYSLAVLGVFTHNAGVMTGPVCLYWSLSHGRGWRRTLRELAPLALLLAVAFYLTMQLMAPNTSSWDAANSYTGDRILPLLLDAFRTLFWFLGRLLSTAHWLPIPPHTRTLWEEGLGLVALAGLGLLLWRRKPVALWAVWTLAFLLPFLALPARIFEGMAVGPSRYLYIATAGSSFLLAWLLQRAGVWAVARGGSVARYLYAGALIALAVPNGFAIRKAEALSFYMSARYYLASGDEKTGKALLEKAMASGPDVINLRDAYFRLAAIQLYFNEDPNPALREALALFPNDRWLSLVKGLTDQESNDKLVQQRGTEQLANIIELANEEVRESLVFRNLASLLHNLGKGYMRGEDYPSAIRAFDRALRINPSREKTPEGLGDAYAQLGFQ